MPATTLKTLAQIEDAARYRGLEHFTNAEVMILLAEIDKLRNPRPPSKPVGPTFRNYAAP